MLVLWPFTTIVHVKRWSAVKSFGTGTANIPWRRPGRKCVGWPMSGPPGSIRLFGPIGTSSTCVVLRFK